MIQFALLFGLGFLTATLIAVLIAPAIHRQIVRYTERRIQATVPISPQEVRAQRDMARAAYAAENARTRQDLVEEKDRGTLLKIKTESLMEDLRTLEGTNAELLMRIDDLDAEAADARARLRQDDSYVEKLKAMIERLEDAASGKGEEMQSLVRDIGRMTSDADNHRIDLSTRDAEIEALKASLGALRGERDTLRRDLQLELTRANEAEHRLSREQRHLRRLEEKLAGEITDRGDRETTLERRLQEIGRLRDRLKAANSEARTTGNTGTAAHLPQAENEAVTAKETEAGSDDAIAQPSAQIPAAAPAAPAATPSSAGAPSPAPAAAFALGIDEDAIDPRFRLLAEEARNRATALGERLMKAKNPATDEAMRKELATIAASMVAVTAAAEGRSSPIRKILRGKHGSTGRESLATKAGKLLSE